MKFEDRHPAIYQAACAIAGLIAMAASIFAAWALYCAIWY